MKQDTILNLTQPERLKEQMEVHGSEEAGPLASPFPLTTPHRSKAARRPGPLPPRYTLLQPLADVRDDAGRDGAAQ